MSQVFLVNLATPSSGSNAQLSWSIPCPWQLSQPAKPFRWFRLRHFALSGGNAALFQYGSLSLNLPAKTSLIYDATNGLSFATTPAYAATGQPYWSPGPWIEIDPGQSLPDPFTVQWNAFTGVAGNLTGVNNLYFDFEFLEDDTNPSWSS